MVSSRADGPELSIRRLIQTPVDKLLSFLPVHRARLHYHFYLTRQRSVAKLTRHRVLLGLITAYHNNAKLSTRGESHEHRANHPAIPDFAPERLDK